MFSALFKKIKGIVSFVGHEQLSKTFKKNKKTEITNVENKAYQYIPI